jgi:hypothetical protein
MEDDSKYESPDSPTPPATTPQDYAVGYGRPPLHSRFKPGQSGNPKGRRKGARSLNALRRELYLSPVQVRDGDKVKKIPRALAIEVALMARALKGDCKAVQLVNKNANELRVYDESFPVETGYPMNLTREQLRYLTNDDFDTLLMIMKKAHAIPDS